MINKELLVKKTYSKPEIEFVAFCYREVVSASEITDVDDDDEGIGGDDMDSVSMPKLSLGFFGLGANSGGDASTGDTEGEYEDTEGGGLGGLLGTDDGVSTDTDTNEQQEVQAEEGGGFFEALGDVVSGNEDIEGGGDDGGAADDGGGDDSSSDSGDTSSSGDSVWTE